MSRKDYIAIADIIRTARNRHPGLSHDIAISYITQELVDYLASNNPRFDRDKFIQATMRTTRVDSK